MQNDDTSFFDFNQDKSGLPRIENVPPAIQGEGGRTRTLEIANQCASAAGSFEEHEAWMRAWNLTCEPPWLGEGTEGIDYWIKDSWAFIRGEDERGEETKILRAVKKRVSLEALDEIAYGARGRYAQLLAGVAGHPIPSSEEIIDQLYPGNPLLCRAAGSERWHHTGSRESIRGVEKEFEWLVINPMRAKTGRTMKGKDGSPRCRDNVGPRKYIVIEFDFGETFRRRIEAWAKKGISPRDVQIALIYHLAATGTPRRFPFMIVDSGGKSLHSWYAIGPTFPEGAALALLARAIPYGADPKADEPERFFRFPGGVRKSERNQPQPILYYDPTTR
jgi:hypothetical protein